jgi:hypothetical protein
MCEYKYWNKKKTKKTTNRNSKCWTSKRNFCAWKVFCVFNLLRTKKNIQKWHHLAVYHIIREWITRRNAPPPIQLLKSTNILHAWLKIKHPPKVKGNKGSMAAQIEQERWYIRAAAAGGENLIPHVFLSLPTLFTLTPFKVQTTVNPSIEPASLFEPPSEAL